MPRLDPASGAFQALEALVADFQNSGARDLHLRAGDCEVFLSTDAGAQGLGDGGRPEPTPPANRAPAPVPAGKSIGAASAVDAATIPAGATVVTAPNLGTFYRSPKPGAAPYVELGSKVEEGTELCLIEVMKLFTAVRSTMRGSVAAILIGDGEMVAAGQPLFAVQPEAAG